jgi:preprotein translocase subunit YajC
MSAPLAAGPNPVVSFMPIIVVVGILYVLVIRPQQKQAREHRKMIDSLKSGDRVLTQGGIYGTVVNLKGPIVQLKIADNVRVDVNRSSITQIMREPSGNPGSPTPAVIGERA